MNAFRSRFYLAGMMAVGMLSIPTAAFCQVQGSAAGAEASAAPAIPVEDQATKEQLGRLFEVMRLRQQLDTMKGAMSSMLQQQVQASTKQMSEKLGSAATPEQQAAANKLIAKFMDRAMNMYPIEEMLDDMTAVYQHHISRSDVEALIAFYGSTPGQHLLDQQPAIMKEYLPLVMQRTQQHTKELTDELEKEMQEVEKSPATSGDTQDKK